VHYWRIAELAGQIIHDIGSSRYHLEGGGGFGTLLGYSGIASDGLAARIPNGGGFIHNGGSLPTLASPCSIECWLYPMGTFGAVQEIFHFGNYGLSFSGATLQLQAFAGGIQVTDPVALTVQSWFHVVMTYDSTTIRLYKNGTQVGTIGGGVAQGATHIEIGQTPTGTNPIDCFITECAWYAGVLSAARVAAHHTAQELTGAPVFSASGASGSNGSVTLDPSQLARILNAVEKTFPTT
jgi:Concanavalin A-like lectin/glucanases superfamily